MGRKKKWLYEWFYNLKSEIVPFLSKNDKKNEKTIGYMLGKRQGEFEWF